jgi:tRNA A37 threonylcarbamoyladenosine dehydratase
MLCDTRRGRVFIGLNKAEIMGILIERDAPWTKVQVIQESPWAPERIDSIIAGADLVLDCTGARASLNNSE